jgi:hypothetical protein
VKKGLSAQRESKYVEFKEEFDPSSAEAWCELIKDIVAIANTGNGAIMIGLGNSGVLSGADVRAVLKLDPATVTDRIARYTGTQFDRFEIIECEKGQQKVAALVVREADMPMVFEKPGTYATPGGKRQQKTAFSRGTVYFRHGAKSEPGNSDDLRRVVERKLESIRKSWVQSVRKVVTAPPGAQVTVLLSEVVQSGEPGAAPIRIVKDKSAPKYCMMSPDDAYPHRQTELIKEVNRKLPKGVSINSYDIQSVRKVHKIDGQEAYMYQSKYGSPQFSDEFVDWIVEQYGKDAAFFDKARQRFYKRRYRS